MEQAINAIYSKEDTLSLKAKANADFGSDMKQEDAMSQMLNANEQCSRRWNSFCGAGNSAGGSAGMENMPNMQDSTGCKGWLLENVGYAQAYVLPQQTVNILPGNKPAVCGTAFAELAMPYNKPAADAVL